MSPGPATVFGLGAHLRGAVRLGTLRTWALGCAVALTVLVACALAATVSSYQGWDDRAAARTPMPAEGNGDAALLEDWGQVRVHDPVDLVDVLYLEPLRSDAPLPPGLASWPEPGEIVVSPALMQSPGAREALSALGTIVGTIDPAGLVEDGERYAYIRPPAGADTGLMYPSNEFGSPFPGTSGAAGRRGSLQAMELLELALLGVPALVLLWGASRVGAERRTRYRRTLALLGASRWQATGVALGEAWPSVMFGILSAAGIVGLSMCVDLPLPGAGFVLRAVDLRDHLDWMLVGFFAGVGIAVGGSFFGSVAGHRQQRPRLRRAAARDARGAAVGGGASSLDGARLLLPPLVAILTMAGINMAFTTLPNEALLALYGLGVVASLMLTPMAVTSGVRMVAARGAEGGWRHGRASELVAGAQLRARPQPPARFAAVVAIVIVILAIAQGYVIMAKQNEQQWASDVAPVAQHSISFQVYSGLSDDAIVGIRQALGDDNIALGVCSDTDGEMVVRGSHEALATLGLEVGANDLLQASQRARDTLRGYLYQPSVTVQAGEAISQGCEAILFPREGSAMPDPDTVMRQLAQVIAPVPYVAPPAEGWVLGARDFTHQTRWVTWFAVPGVAMILTALWCGYANELTRASRALAAPQLFDAGSGFVSRVLASRVIVPVGIGGAFGAVLALIFSLPQYNAGSREWHPPVGFIIAAILACLVSAGVAWVVCRRACLTAARDLKLSVEVE